MALLHYEPQSSVPRISGPAKSAASIIAILCAIGSLVVGNAAGKMLLAIIAVVAGLVGMLRAIHPHVSGGLLSVVAIVLAAIGFFMAIFDALF